MHLGLLGKSIHYEITADGIEKGNLLWIIDEEKAGNFHYINGGR